MSVIDFWPLNTALYVTDFKGNDVRFCYYLLKTIDFAGYNSGSAQPSLNRNFIADIPLFVPAPHEQRAIAGVLGALDDKIEANRHMNVTLEALARALFKSWFVDFDPVRAKAEGRPPALAPDLAALFPARLTESPLGPIPEGWEVRALGDLVLFVNERRTAGEETASKPYVPIDSIAARSVVLPGFRPGSEAQSSLVAFKKNDILFGAMRPYFHKVAIAPFEGTTRTTVFVLRAIEPFDTPFALMALSSDDTIEFATAHSTGSTIPYAVWPNSMEKMPLVLPSQSARAAYGDVVMPLVRRAKLASAQSRLLSQLRDLLLPKLLSGALRVRDAERMIGDAA